MKFTKLALASVAAMLCTNANAEMLSVSGGANLDVGLDDPVVVPDGQPLRVAMFMATQSNVYTQAMTDEALKTAERDGFELEIFDAQFDTQTQMNQLENALASGRFDAWYVAPVDGALMCNIITKDAPSENILVAISNIAICGRDHEPFANNWEPGILSYVGAGDTPDYVNGWIDAIVEARGDQETRAIVVKGFAGLSLTTNTERKLAEVQEQHPNFKVVGETFGDFTAATAQASVDTLLLAHPDANVIITVYSDMTLGAINALEDSDRLDSVDVYDLGAGADSIPLIEAGHIDGSTPFSPRSHVRESLGAIVGAWRDGQVPPRTIEALVEGTAAKPHLVTRENVGDYTPEY